MQTDKSVYLSLLGKCYWIAIAWTELVFYGKANCYNSFAVKIASWRLICKKDWSLLNYFSSIVCGESILAPQKSWGRAVNVIAAYKLVQQAACLASSISSLCVISMSLKKEWDFWW